MEHSKKCVLEWYQKLQNFKGQILAGTADETLILNLAMKIAERRETEPEDDPLIQTMGRKACAQLLGVSLPTLDRYVRLGMPHRIKNPDARQRKHYVFLPLEVLEWQKSHLSGNPFRRLP